MSKDDELNFAFAIIRLVGYNNKMMFGKQGLLNEI